MMIKKLFVVFLFLLTSCITNIYQSGNVKVSGSISAAYKSVVLLSIENSSGGGVVATGFAYDKDRILTAGHFCISSLEIQIFESHKENIKMKHYNSGFNLVTQTGLKIEDISRTQDICMLRKENHGLPVLPIVKNYNDVKIRDEITIVGVPAGTAIGEFGGRVMSLFYNDGPTTVKGKLIVSGASTGGVSGSPIILNRTGEVIGVLVMGHTYFDHLSFGVTGDEINRFIRALR